MPARPLRRLATAAACLALLPGPALAAKYQPKGRPVEYRGHFSPFPSGLRLVVYEMPHLDRFSLSVSYRAGAVDDPAGKEGLAHLAEHVAFRAAPGASGQRIWERLVASGMSFNALTAMDHTDYWITGKPEELGQALRIEAARMSDPTAGVTEDDFAVERDVVISEWRERHETTGEAAKAQWLRELAFAGHPYGRATGGTPETLKTITLDDVRAWTKARYDPAGVVMVIVSPFPPQDAVQRVIAAFEPLLGDPAAPRQPLVHSPPAMPARSPRGGEVPTRAAPVGKAELWVAWRVPGTYAGLEPQTLAAAIFLEDFLWGRLGHLALNDVVDGIDVQLGLMDGAGLLAVKVVLHDESKARLILDTVKFAASELVLAKPAEYMAGIRDWLLVRAYLNLERIESPDIAQYLRATGRPDFFGDWPKRVAVQLQRDVDAFATTHLDGDAAVAMLVVPDRNIRAIDVAGGAARRPVYADPTEDDAASVPPPSAERVAAVLRQPGLVRAERRTLANGLQVAFLQHGTLPVGEVRVALKTPAEGSASSPLGAPELGLASSDVSFVNEKTRLFGLSRTFRPRADSLVFAGRGSSGNLADILETEARWAKRVSFSAPVFDRLKRFVRRVQASADRSPLERARRALHEGLFPGHPFGAAVTADAIDALTSRQASAWVRATIRPERATAIVVSDVAPGPEGWRWIEREFKGWDREGAGPVPPTPIAPVPAARSVRLVERRGATQALVAVGFRAPPLAERDAAALDAVRWLLESRLNQRVRVEEGASYGVSVSVVEHRGAAALVVAAAVDAGAAARAAQTVLRAAADLAAEPLQPASAARARWMVAREFASRFDTVGGAADALETIALHDLPADHFDRMPASIAALDAARIQAAARSLTVGREVVVVSGDRALLPALEAAGLAAEVRAEPEGTP